MKQFLAEFKTFALRGNVLDMAVGIIIGGAFTAIVTSLTENFITPILNIFMAGDPFTLEEVGASGAAFIGAVVNFLLTAFILFCLIRAINKMVSLGKKEEAAAPTTKMCPYCRSEIAIEATKCPCCTSDLPQ